MSRGRSTLAWCLLLCGVLFGVAFSARAEETVRVALGSHRLLERARAVERIAIGSSQVIEVEVISDREVLLLGRQEGRTSLILWHRGGHEELQVEVYGSERSTPAALDEPELHLGPSGEITGRARSLRGLTTARAIAGERGSRLDTSELGFDSQVQIDVRVVEVSRQAIDRFGVELMRNTRGSAHALAPPGTLAGIAGEGAGIKEAFEGFVFGSPSGFLPLSDAFQLVAANTHSGFVGILSVLESHGFAHTLAKPSLVASSGRTASFLVGGEFPIPVAQGGSSDGATISIEYREFGIRVDLRPFVLARDHIVLEVAPEVSDLDFSAGVSIAGVSVPALTTRRAETTIELGDGESFVIGGLISRNVLRNVDRIPALSNVPILGNFFRRRRDQESDRELVMIVSPHLVRPLKRDAAPESAPSADPGGAGTESGTDAGAESGGTGFAP